MLPSPNGSAISAAVIGTPVIAACLRNASAVARWIAGQGRGIAERPLAVIAAGEYWPGHNTLRPALEDWLGAAAVVSESVRNGAGPLSPEAAAARACYAGIADVAALIADCASGRELIGMRFADDVAIATEIDSSGAVPVLADGASLGHTIERSVMVVTWLDQATITLRSTKWLGAASIRRYRWRLRCWRSDGRGGPAQGATARIPLVESAAQRCGTRPDARAVHRWPDCHRCPCHRTPLRAAAVALGGVPPLVRARPRTPR
ncbi:2-phosphosulfolactate phosphatase [Nocardia sp. 004]|uniref:2-phosphosulfolactate phosphatase n=1 Tax=Nocardia sp. 004 TaxID=3385978 RepID=UPI0039A2F0B2